MKLIDDLRAWVAKARREGAPAKPVAGPSFGLEAVESFLREYDRERESARQTRTMLSTVMMGVVTMVGDPPDPAERAKMPEGHLRFYLRFHNGYERVAHLIPVCESPAGLVSRHRVLLGSLAEEREGRMKEPYALHGPHLQVVLNSVIDRIADVHGPCLECVEGDGPTRAELLATVERLRSEGYDE